MVVELLEVFIGDCVQKTVYEKRLSSEGQTTTTIRCPYVYMYTYAKRNEIYLEYDAEEKRR